MPQDKGSRRSRLEETSKPGQMKKILDEMDAEMKSQRRSKSKGGGTGDRGDRDADKDRDKNRHRDDRGERRDDKDKRDRDKDRESRHRDDKDRDRKHRDDKDRESRHRDDKDRERRHKDDKDRDSKHKDDRDRERRHRDDKDRESKHRDDRDRDGRHRDDKDRERRHRDDKDRDKHTSDDKDKRDRDRDRRDKDRDDRDRHSKDKDRGESRHREDGERRDKDKDRDRRDKDRDSRHREDRDRDKRRDEDRPRDKDRKSGGGSSSAQQQPAASRSNGKAAEAAAAKDEEAGGGDDYNYDDDEFENYDEDFDDFDDDDNEDDEEDGGKAKPPRRGAAEEEEDGERPKPKPYERQPRRGSDDDDDGRPDQGQQKPRPKALIDFFGAKKRQANTAASSRTQRRWDELSRLIDLDKVTYDLFQLAPLEEYALYMRQYGRTNAHQAASQTNEDAVDREAMTDEVEVATRWTQNPPGDLDSAGGLAAAADAADDDDDEEEDDSRGRRKHKKQKQKQQQLSQQYQQPSAKSLQRTLELVRRVLEEQAKPRVPNGRREAAGHLSSGFTPLTPPSGYPPATLVSFDPRRASSLLTVHPAAAGGGGGASLLLLWNVHEPDLPRCALAAPASVACVCWTPDGLVCAGLDDGALCLWDPAEPAALHGAYDAAGVSVRGPTYSTAWLLGRANHQSGGLVGLAPVGRALHSGGAYQLASVDPAGRLQAWVASAHAGPADPAGSASDLGLRPGGRVSLMRSSRADLGGGLLPVCLVGGEAALVGTADGRLLRVGAGVGASRRAHPRQIGPSHPSGVTAIDVSPHQRPGLLLVGHADGAVRVLAASAAAAGDDGGGSSSSYRQLLSLQPRPDAIRRLVWSRSRPAVFFSLDVEGRLLVYDLAAKATGPVSVFAESGVVDFALGEDFHSTGRGAKSDRAVCALCRGGSGGEVEVHVLAESLSCPELDEGYRLSQLMDQLLCA